MVASIFQRNNMVILGLSILFSVFIGVESSKGNYSLIIGVPLVLFFLLCISKVIKEPKYLLFFVIGLVPFENNISLFKGIDLFQFFILSLIAVFSMHKIIHPNLQDKSIPMGNKFHMLILIYLVLSIIALFIGSDQADFTQFIRGLNQFILPCCLVLIGHQTIKKKEDIYRIINAIIILTTVGSLIAIIQYLSHGHLLSGQITNYKYLGFFNYVYSYLNDTTVQYVRAFVIGTSNFRAHGTFLNSNFFATFIGFIAPLSLGSIFLKNTFKVKLLYFIMFTIQVAAIYVTFSRGGLYSLVLSILFILLFYTKKKTVLLMPLKIFMTCFMLFITYIIASPLILAGSSNRYLNFDLSNINEVQDRLIVWRITLDSIKKHLFFGTGNDFLSPESTSFLLFKQVSPHNLYLQILNTSGIFVFIAFMLIVITTLVINFKSYYFSDNVKDRILLFGLFAGLLSFLANGFKESLLLNYNLKLTFWVFILLIVCFNKLIVREKNNA